MLGDEENEMEQLKSTVEDHGDRIDDLEDLEDAVEILTKRLNDLDASVDALDKRIDVLVGLLGLVEVRPDDESAGNGDPS